jgi:hypothetical protein
MLFDQPPNIPVFRRMNATDWEDVHGYSINSRPVTRISRTAWSAQ